MRTPKYQAWDKQEKRMIAVPRLSFGEDGSARTVIIELRSREGYYRMLVVGENAELREFTGLRNKYGVEVYEGDILQISSGRKMHVVWHSTAFCWDVVALNSEGVAVSFAQLRYTPFEVIGNRYQHPELLEVSRCDYCNATKGVTTLSDRTGKEPDIHICQDCYACGVETKLGEYLAKGTDE